MGPLQTERITIHSLDFQAAADAVDALSDVLMDCVAGGASVGFMAPLTHARAGGFWRGVAEAVRAGERILIVACREPDGGIAGTVQVVLDLPENQPHRAEIAKVLVRRSARRRGIARRLMEAAEAAALGAGRTLLLLDTVTGSAAEELYTGMGWQRVGSVPDYALLPDGEPCSTTFFYKRLEGITG